jgi:hypothetical protein
MLVSVDDVLEETCVVLIKLGNDPRHAESSTDLPLTAHLELPRQLNPGFVTLLTWLSRKRIGSASTAPRP